MDEIRSRSAQDAADRQLNKVDKRARKLLSAAKRGGAKGAGLAEAAALLMSEVAGHRVEQAKAEVFRRCWAGFVEERRSLVSVMTSAKESRPAPADEGLPDGPGTGSIQLPRVLQVYSDIRKLSELRRTADPALRADLEAQINALVDEYLTIKRAEVNPVVENYRMMVSRNAAERLAGVLVDLELAEQPQQHLEALRDRLGVVLSRCAELSARDEIRAATGADETP